MDEREKAELEDLAKRASQLASSKEGRASIEAVFKLAEDTSDELERMRRIDPQILTMRLR
ncbi:MAG: hypothetical protein H7844_09450 [Nitrospirae bacterium YQR-1]